MGLILLGLGAPYTQAKPQVDHPLIAAKAASEASNLQRLLQAQSRLAQDPLKVWADYWVTRLAVMQDPFGSGTPARVAQFVKAVGLHPTTKLLLKDWGHSALLKGTWDQVAPVIDGLDPLPESPGLACARARRQIERDQIPIAQGVELVRGNETKEGCLFLLEAIDQRLPLPADALQTYARWAAEGGDLEAARRIWQLASTNDSRLGRELALLTLLASSRPDSLRLAQRIEQGKIPLSDPQRAFAKGILAGRLFVRSDPRAWSYLQEALRLDPNLLAQLPDPTLEALARLCLRRGDWSRLHQVLSALSPAAQAEDGWKFWRGWLAQRRGEPEEARRLWESIPMGWGFYQQLASASLGRAAPSGRRSPGLTPEVLRAREQLKTQAGLQRAFLLADLGLRVESSLEWRTLLEKQSDASLLAAAELALARGHIDRAIFAAIRTQDQHDLSLRYPRPFQRTIDRYAALRSLDESWVYGLIRQESRFLPQARSPVGAAGLMQIMPRTAKSLAREEGIRDFKPSTITEPDLNVRLGTRYLKTLLEQFDGSWVLATAAYNAGPARSRLWQASLIQEIPGAAFAESIPFTETRDYVKLVLANTAAYQAPASPSSLLPLIGPLGPRSPAKPERLSLEFSP